MVVLGQDSLLPPPPDITFDFEDTNTYKEYFFNDRLKINDSTSLVLIIEDAQTQMTSDLNHRIYDDTAFIRKVKNRFYEEKAINGDVETHFCGHDMFFYSLCNGKLTFLNRLNSNCGLSEVSCQDLGILFESGRQMRVDTLTSLPEKYIKSRDELFSDNVIESHYQNTQSWGICKSSKFPKIYYDGYFHAEILLDSAFTINQNIENFISQYSNDFTNLNWNLWSNVIEVRRFNYFHESIKVEIVIYLKKDLFDQFESFDIQPITPVINENRKLLIFYDD